jgi:magnesium-transporting ATPase (P-type)
MDAFETKYSTLDKNINFVFGVFISLIMLMICVGSLVNKAWIELHYDSYQYIFECAESPEFMAGMGGLTMFLILTPLVPLQLLINMDMTKLIMSRFMQRDAWMMYP